MVTGAKQHFVLAILAKKLPGSLEEFKELADDIAFRWIDNDSYHREFS
jgi:hypothetical protein